MLGKKELLTSEGNTIVNDHNSAHYVADELLQVQCIDIKELLEDASEYDVIHMKLDIESSEYNVLERMIETDT